jgi:hypothetical protein
MQQKIFCELLWWVKFRRHSADDFLHHDGHFKGDRQSLMKAMEENHVQNPNKILTVKHVSRTTALSNYGTSVSRCPPIW